MIRILSIEIYKCVKGTNPDYLNEMFSLSNSHYDLCDQSRLEQPKFNTKTFGYQSFKYLGAKLWNLLPSHPKSIDDLHIFKSNLHKWCLTEKAHLWFLRIWIYSNKFSVWFDWISTYFVLFISFIASLFSTITISFSYHPHSFLVCGWVFMLW